MSSLRLAMAAIRDANASTGYGNWPAKKVTAELIRKQAADHARARRTEQAAYHRIDTIVFEYLVDGTCGSTSPESRRRSGRQPLPPEQGAWCGRENARG
ncbi:hypothetical protein [Kitasatospora aureofaciens]|uniref:hypothetical protein n=1 Tax=Kitasatospora aureofaciens TaxID=1894 RepID=UPI0037C523C2